VTPTVGTNTLLAPLMAGGGNYATSQVQAGAQREELERERMDFLNTATKGFASQNIGLGLDALGQAQGSYHRQEELRAQKEAGEADFGDWFASIMPSLVSLGLMIPTGGGSVASGAGMSPGGGGYWGGGRF